MSFLLSLPHNLLKRTCIICLSYILEKASLRDVSEGFCFSLLFVSPTLSLSHLKKEKNYNG